MWGEHILELMHQIVQTTATSPQDNMSSTLRATAAAAGSTANDAAAATALGFRRFTLPVFWNGGGCCRIGGGAGGDADCCTNATDPTAMHSSAREGGRGGGDGGDVLGGRASTVGDGTNDRCWGDDGGGDVSRASSSCSSCSSSCSSSSCDRVVNATFVMPSVRKILESHGAVSICCTECLSPSSSSKTTTSAVKNQRRSTLIGPELCATRSGDDDDVRTENATSEGANVPRCRRLLQTQPSIAVPVVTRKWSAFDRRSSVPVNMLASSSSPSSGLVNSCRSATDCARVTDYGLDLLSSLTCRCSSAADISADAGGLIVAGGFVADAGALGAAVNSRRPSPPIRLEDPSSSLAESPPSPPVDRPSRSEIEALDDAIASCVRPEEISSVASRRRVREELCRLTRKDFDELARRVGNLGEIRRLQRDIERVRQRLEEQQLDLDARRRNFGRASALLRSMELEVLSDAAAAAPATTTLSPQWIRQPMLPSDGGGNGSGSRTCAVVSDTCSSSADHFDNGNGGTPVAGAATEFGLYPEWCGNTWCSTNALRAPLDAGPAAAAAEVNQSYLRAAEMVAAANLAYPNHATLSPPQAAAAAADVAAASASAAAAAAAVTDSRSRAVGVQLAAVAAAAAAAASDNRSGSSSISTTPSPSRPPQPQQLQSAGFCNDGWSVQQHQQLLQWWQWQQQWQMQQQQQQQQLLLLLLLQQTQQQQQYLWQQQPQQQQQQQQHLQVPQMRSVFPTGDVISTPSASSSSSSIVSSDVTIPRQPCGYSTWNGVTTTTTGLLGNLDKFRDRLHQNYHTQ